MVGLPGGEIRRNMQIFELLGARRVKLSGNQCGYVQFGNVYSCFSGHDAFETETIWVDHYTGPAYSRDIVQMLQAEAQLRRVGLHGAYAARLVPLVYPGWEQVSSGEQVWNFWFQIAHAPVERRFVALWRMREQLRVVDFEPNYPLTDHYPSARDVDVLARAIELAPSSDLESEARATASAAFRRFVEDLTPYEAVVLLSQMHVGRRDFQSVVHAMAALGQSYESNASIASQLLAERTLVQNLKAALRLAAKDRW
jgi:hypothetical protein